MGITSKEFVIWTPLKESIPEGFDTDLRNLPLDFVCKLGLFTLHKARFELILGTIMNNTGHRVDPKHLWPSKGKAWAVKWRKALENIENPTDLENTLIEKLGQAISRHLFDFRNDLTHTAIIAFHNDGRLFGQRYRTTNRNNTLALEEGILCTINEFENATKEMIKWCSETEMLLSKHTLKPIVP